MHLWIFAFQWLTFDQNFRQNREGIVQIANSAEPWAIKIYSADKIDSEHWLAEKANPKGSIHKIKRNRRKSMNKNDILLLNIILMI